MLNFLISDRAICFLFVLRSSVLIWHFSVRAIFLQLFAFCVFRCFWSGTATPSDSVPEVSTSSTVKPAERRTKAPWTSSAWMLTKEQVRVFFLGPTRSHLKKLNSLQASPNRVRFCKIPDFFLPSLHPHTTWHTRWDKCFLVKCLVRV